jgi:BRCT domain type II-containing protein
LLGSQVVPKVVVVRSSDSLKEENPVCLKWVVFVIGGDFGRLKRGSFWHFIGEALAFEPG